MPATLEAPAAPVAAAPVKASPQPQGGDVAIPQVASIGAQAVKPAPAGTIPAPLQPFSQQPQSAMAKVKERLRNKALGNPSQTPPAPEQKKAAESTPTTKEDKEIEAPAPAPEGEEDLMEAELGEEEKTATAPEAKKDEVPAASDDKTKKEKVNPWKLVEEHKTHRAKLEQENAELKKLVPNAELRKAEMAEVEKIKQRNQELEKHMQFVDYQKSEEFETKYEKPYKDQWQSSMRDLKGVTVETDGGERAIEPGDLVALVNMTKVEARKVVNENFGDFANDVMAERDKIRATWDAKQKALEEAKTNGVAKSEEAMKAHRETHEKLNGEVHEIYTKAVDSISKDTRIARFITPKDGDPKQNEILTKGLAMVDEAFRMNPMDPTLTPKQRETIVKKHAAVRFRSAGYGVARYELAKLQTAYDEVTAKLAEYEGTVPNRGGSQTAAAPAAGGGSAMSRMQQRLRARASK